MFEGADLRRASVFHAVAKAGGIAAAARAIGKSAPAAHADLRRFERDMGVTLMERTGRALRLTPQGRALFDTIGRALGEIARVREHLQSPETSRLPLRIGAVTGFGRYRLAPQLLPVLDRDRPLTLVTGAHDELIEALALGRIDFAITYRPVTLVPIESVAIAEERLVLVGAPPDAGMIEQIEQIERLRFVTYDEYDYVFGRWFAEVFDRQPATLIRHDHCTELEEALASVRAGRGTTIAPLDACRAFGLAPVGKPCANTLYLCGIGSALESPEAALLRASLAQPESHAP